MGSRHGSQRTKINLSFALANLLNLGIGAREEAFLRHMDFPSWKQLMTV